MSVTLIIMLINKRGHRHIIEMKEIVTQSLRGNMITINNKFRVVIMLE